MFDIHLAWSPLMLAIGLLLVLLNFLLTIRKKFMYKAPVKNWLIVDSLFLVVVLVCAFDVGTRQVDLNRGRFDALPNERTIDKVESRQHNATTVQQQFKEAVDEKTQKIKAELN